VKSGIWEPAF